MRLRTSLRASCALWALPFAIALSLFYYFAANSTAPPNALHFAPAITSAPILPLYAIAYAFAGSLATWESGRLRSAGIWALSPARSRYRVAAHALLPVLGTSWIVLILPTTLALVQYTTFPTLDSLRLLAMAILVCAGHAVLGFAIGMRVSHVIAAPIVAATIWVMVAFSWAVDPPWLRHVSGQYPTDLMFGEVPSLISLTPHILLTWGIAAGVSLLWLPLRSGLARITLGFAIALAGPVGAYEIARDWSYNPPLTVGQAEMACLGESPKVCMPEATASHLPKVRRDVVSVLNGLEAAGINTSPVVITDRVVDGRFSRPSTAKSWRLPLTAAAERGSVRFQTLGAAVRFPCTRPDFAAARPAMLWAAEVTHLSDSYRKWVSQQGEPATDDTAGSWADTQKVVAKTRLLPVEQQAQWFAKIINNACDEKA
ncbi:hypothetical protein [Streptomyces himalayensis]|uniref:Uncharacterized protein n=1 Tax=Streptomyces himalayensis subsp. himalayensis TaxID=2756131 RepID=A0A7W0DQD3_9ACTN|nr:hypothetical protein [Streptomyces himalayensis]MBA2949276.1 hypothetical protein [Streptomyces himalayensis subsp. himalayensis]